MKKEDLLNLMNQMTLEEKIGQLVQVKGDTFLEENVDATTGPLKSLNLSQEQLFQVGSILNITGSKRIRKVQDEYLSKSRLKIPLLFMADVINGYKIAFPTPLAQGCSWNRNVVKGFAKIALQESSISGVNVNFSPMVDLARDARWGRVMETVGGEDPFLAQEFGKIIVNAYQGNSIENFGRMASCVKHFAAYGAAEAGRDYNTVDISEREFRQYYLPAYKYAIDSGAEMVMTSFNIINGIPCSVNKWLLQDILRKELGFKGIVISDYSAIAESIAHGLCIDGKDAAYKAIMSGVDIDMMSNIYASNLSDVVNEHPEVEGIINDSVMRILSLKNKLGLFENPYGYSDYDKEIQVLVSNDNLKKAKDLTAETFVLLKNDNNLLPLNPNLKVALIGPYGDNIGISGSWCIFSDKTHIKTLKECFSRRVTKHSLLYSKGCEILSQEEMNKILSATGHPLLSIENEKDLLHKLKADALDIAKKSDVIVLAIGEHYTQSGEACSRANLNLPDIQQDLLDELHKLNKPIIAVLFNGRPIEVKSIYEKVDSLLEVWFPGTQGAESIVDVILGDVNPSGKLTMSFPYSVGQCPIYYNHYSTGRPHNMDIRYVSRYQDIPTDSYFPFGFGLSYCEFKYSNLVLDKGNIDKDSIITAKITVKNESNISGYEVVQLYIQDLFGSVVRPVKELKDFKKVYFEANEEKEISFEINFDMLKFWNDKLKYVVEPGRFKVFIGKNSKECLEDYFEFC